MIFTLNAIWYSSFRFNQFPRLAPRSKEDKLILAVQPKGLATPILPSGQHGIFFGSWLHDSEEQRPRIKGNRKEAAIYRVFHQLPSRLTAHFGRFAHQIVHFERLRLGGWQSGVLLD
jgi:hypothetical protein